ncbi:ferric reductase-like transmembrane domain-containing protein [Lentzea sp. NPDC051213]|uniref:ferredoxin reductase family protein n=1 Tax=Lentzea sp. NPDC051213 TaxID=3364126 RepID=UPI0037ADEF85
MSATLTRPARTRSRRRPFGWADLLGPLGIGTIVAVLFLWLHNQGLASVYSGSGRTIGSLGLLTGLLSADLMLLQTFLLARIPWVERAWGRDVLVQRHRLFGLWSFWLMVAHVALFAVERWGRNGWAAVWAVFVTDSWMLFATAGTVMIIGVVVTSIRWARRRLRYESWHLLHLYAYLGIGFAFPHQLVDGADFHGPIALAFWWTLYLTALAAVLVYRVGQPLWRSWYHRLRVTGVVTEAPDVVSVTVHGRRLEKLRTRSGQFFTWRFLGGPGWTRGHPYTISAAPRRDHLRVTIQVVGDGSARAAQLEPGTRVLVEGPYGTMTARQRTHPRMVLIAAGVGITPMRALLEDSPYAPGEATLIYRFREHAIFVDELNAIADKRKAELLYLPGPRRADGSWQPAGSRRDDAQALTDLVPDLADRDIYVCGPPAWNAAVRAALRRAGARSDQIHSEDFGW